MSKVKNPRAFPIEFSAGFGGDDQKGMALSDYFEAKAMQALIASNFISRDGIPDVRYDYDELAAEAELYADAMLKKRSNDE